MNLKCSMPPKKKTYPALVFLLGLLILTVILYQSDKDEQEHLRTITHLNAATYGEHLSHDIYRGIMITDALEDILISENGKIDNFPKVADKLMTDYTQSIQIAPNGVVTDIYPAAGNEAGKIDLLNDPARGEICRYGRDYKVVTLQGPFDLKQGGQGIAIRNPVYLEDTNGNSKFWGFTITIIRVPDIFANSVQALTNFGYDYQLSKNIFPGSDTYEEVSSSSSALENPVNYTFDIGGSSFQLSVVPKHGLHNPKELFLYTIIGLCVVLFLTGLTAVILMVEDQKRILQITATTDPLTGLLNRKGFDEQMKKVMVNHPNLPCVGVQMDIDDFKFINDMYGHAIGDMALQTLAQSMRNAFPKEAILCRNGGDEFSILWVGVTEDEAKETIHKFTHQPRFFSYQGEQKPFYISLGYAAHRPHGSDVVDLIRFADVALYEVKLHGKHNCLAYRPEYKIQHRCSLGFRLQDISRNLPGAFLIYTADPQNDRILFANHEMIELAGCQDFDDFMEYSQQHFHHLIRPDEQAAVEASIWKQISSEKAGNNDYVKFHFVKKDGTCRPVLDHGRRIHNSYYGDVFYVLIMDCDLVESYYRKSRDS